MLVSENQKVFQPSKMYGTFFQKYEFNENTSYILLRCTLLNHHNVITSNDLLIPYGKTLEEENTWRLTFITKENMCFSDAMKLRNMHKALIEIITEIKSVSPLEQV